jgi:hypothetical protein
VEDGHGPGLWGIPATGAVDTFIPVMVFAFLYGLHGLLGLFGLGRPTPRGRAISRPTRTTSQPTARRRAPARPHPADRHPDQHHLRPFLDEQVMPVRRGLNDRPRPLNAQRSTTPPPPAPILGWLAFGWLVAFVTVLALTCVFETRLWAQHRQTRHATPPPAAGARSTP